MATVTPRRLLIVKIQKRLCDLSVSQLRTVVTSVEDGSMTRNLDGLSEAELYDLIVEYIRGEKLRALEDEGMAQLLLLDDIVSDLLSTDVGGAGDHLAVPLEMEDIPNQQQECPTSPHTDPTHPDRHLAMPADHIPTPPLHPNTDSHTQPILPRDRDISTFPSSMLTDPNTPTKNFNIPASASPAPSVAGVSPGRVSRPSRGYDQVLSLSDVAALFPRREFKLHGGQISDLGSDMSYSSLCKQIDEGLQEGFTECEIIRTVLKIMKPGTLKEMLTNKDDLTVDGLKKLLRSHIRDKNSAELFQELSNAKQQDKESAQQFLYRIIGLKQRVLFESRQPGADFNYDKKLVQGTFLHTLYQGFNEKNNYVRQDLKPFLNDLQVSDDFLLEQITKSTSEEAERLRRLGTASKTRPVTVSAAQLANTDLTEQAKVDTELQANRAAIRELTAQVSSLTRQLTKVVSQTDSVTSGDSCSPLNHPPTPPAENRGRCGDCVQQGKVSCPHCFACGQAGHRAIGCLRRKVSGNGVRSLERGCQ